MSATLVIPGLGGSGPAHWQSWLEAQIPGAERVEQASWDAPDLLRWSRRIAAAVERQAEPPRLVAHSFGCLAAVHAMRSAGAKVAGLMLVAPADPAHWRLEAAVLGVKLPAPAILVSSASDPWMRPERAGAWASRWGAARIDLGDAGHINEESGYGPWPQGLDLLEGLGDPVRVRRSHG